MKLFRKITDERQELEILRVASGAYGVAKIGLIVAIIVQLLLFGPDPARIAGELIILALTFAFSLMGSIRHGIWDGFTRPSLKSYILYSLTAGIIFGPVAPLARYFRYGTSLSDDLQGFAIMFTIIFVFCFMLMLLTGTVIKARRRRLEMECQDEDDS